MIQGRCSTGLQVAGLTGDGSINILIRKQMQNIFTMKCSICSQCSLLLRILRSGLTQVCTGLTALQVLRRDTFMSIRILPNLHAPLMPIRTVSRTPVSFSPSVTTSLTKAVLWIYGFVKQDFSSMAREQVQTSQTSEVRAST